MIDLHEYRADLVTQAMTQCPDTKVVMAGYSQGGQLVHNAAKMLPASTTSKVMAAVIFGDPGTLPSSPYLRLEPCQKRVLGGLLDVYIY